MRIYRLVCSVSCLLALLSVAGCHSCRKGAPASPVSRGVDVFETSSAPGKATKVDFTGTPIPGGFFCPGSPPFNGQIELRGEPLVPGMNFDTAVERLAEGSFASGSATIPVKVRALRLTSTAPITVACPAPLTPDWSLEVCACGDQPTTEIVVKVDQECGCGHFDGTLDFKTCLRFTNGNGTKTGPIPQQVKLKINNMPWCPKPMKNALQIPGPFTVKDCDGQDMTLSGTSNFFPNTSCAELEPDVDCFVKHADLTTCHEGPTPDHQHCVNPVCDKQRG